jgi:hypothetical protein
MKIEGRQDIEAREVASDVAGIGPVDHLDESLAALFC